MKNGRFPSLSFLLIVFLLPSCVVYYPHQKNIALMEEEKELQADLGVGFVKPNVHVSLAWSPVQHFEMAASGEFDADYLKFFQLEGGYYNKINQRFNQEFLAGLGFGRGEAREEDQFGTLGGQLWMPYFQYNFGQRHLGNDNFDYGFGLKTGWLYSHLEDYLYYNMDPRPKDIIYFYDHSIVLEPKAFLKFGWKNVKVNCQAGYCFIYKFTNRDYELPYSPVGLSFGINYIFQKSRSQ